MSISYQIGDATNPNAAQPTILVHVCNDAGGWGQGFVLALGKRWPEAERDYRRWSTGLLPQPFRLGEVRIVNVSPTISVANMIAQHGYRSASNPCPLQYDALQATLSMVALEAQACERVVAMPRIGCGLAGGTWDRVAELIDSTLIKQGIEVVVYDLPNG